MTMKAQLWISRLLLAFVLVTVGFALGRQTAPSSRIDAVGSAVEASASQGEKVIVYAAHMTFRCMECNQIELLTRQLLDTEFADELASGRIEFRSVDFLRDTEFARRYDIASSTVVVARFDGARLAGFERLDEVWTKLRNRDEFIAYVRSAIESHLQREGI
jgi:hypothetical protein